MKWEDLTLKKRHLDALRPLDPGLVLNLSAWLRIELTFASNALEGNTLTRQETALVVEEGLSVGGKSLREHLEAVNHAKALDWAVELSRSKAPLDEEAVLKMHDLVLRGILDDHAGRYRNVPVRISGSRSVLPSPQKVGALMSELGRFLQAGPQNLHPAEYAAEAHLRLVSIHPFVDGNGRSGRLLMNLALLRHGYPLAVIRLRDRLNYLKALEEVQTGGPRQAYDKLVYDAVDRGLDLWLDAALGKAPAGAKTKVKARPGGLWRIGQLAKASAESVATLRHWTKLGLLKAEGQTDTGYTLYAPSALTLAQKIRALQRQRLSLAEIFNRLNEP